MVFELIEVQVHLQKYLLVLQNLHYQLKNEEYFWKESDEKIRDIAQRKNQNTVQHFLHKEDLNSFVKRIRRQKCVISPCLHSHCLSENVKVRFSRGSISKKLFFVFAEKKYAKGESQKFSNSWNIGKHSEVFFIEKMTFIQKDDNVNRYNF